MFEICKISTHKRTWIENIKTMLKLIKDLKSISSRIAEI